MQKLFLILLFALFSCSTFSQGKYNTISLSRNNYLLVDTSIDVRYTTFNQLSSPQKSLLIYNLIQDFQWNPHKYWGSYLWKIRFVYNRYYNSWLYSYWYDYNYGLFYNPWFYFDNYWYYSYSYPRYYNYPYYRHNYPNKTQYRQRNIVRHQNVRSTYRIPKKNQEQPIRQRIYTRKSDKKYSPYEQILRGSERTRNYNTARTREQNNRQNYRTQPHNRTRYGIGTNTNRGSSVRGGSTGVSRSSGTRGNSRSTSRTSGSSSGNSRKR